MRTSNEDLKRIQSGLNYVHSFYYFSDYPLDPIHKDLQDLKTYEQVEKIQTQEDFINWTKTFHNIDTESGYVSSKDILDMFDSAIDHKTKPYIELLPVKYGIRAKVYQILFIENKPRIQYQLEL